MLIKLELKKSPAIPAHNYLQFDPETSQGFCTCLKPEQTKITLRPAATEAPQPLERQALCNFSVISLKILGHPNKMFCFPPPRFL